MKILNSLGCLLLGLLQLLAHFALHLFLRQHGEELQRGVVALQVKNYSHLKIALEEGVFVYDFFSAVNVTSVNQNTICSFYSPKGNQCEMLTWQAMTLALVSVTRDTTRSLASRKMEPAFLQLRIR